MGRVCLVDRLDTVFIEKTSHVETPGRIVANDSFDFSPSVPKSTPPASDEHPVFQFALSYFASRIISKFRSFSEDPRLMERCSGGNYFVRFSG